MKKLMIASPCQNGKCDTTFTLSLIQTCYILDKNNIKVQLLLPPSGSLLVKERNDILEAFWRSDCTHLLMIDSDLGWEPDAPLKFLQHDVDVIAGVYPIRTNVPTAPKFIFIPKLNDNGTVVENNRLIGALNVPAGFLMITREVLKKLRDNFENLRYETPGPIRNFDSAYALFNTEVINGAFYGEDYVFCEKLRQIDINIWCDPSIFFDHAGTAGRLVEILTNQKPISNTFEYKV